MEEKNSNKKDSKKLIASIIAIAFVIIAMLCIYFSARPKTTSDLKNITLEVIDDNGRETDYSIETDAEYLADAFDDTEGLSVEGEDSQYGLYITTVNGLTADYDNDGAFWSIYVNGEYGQYGADSQPVSNGDDFQLVYETNAR